MKRNKLLRDLLTGQSARESAGAFHDIGNCSASHFSQLSVSAIENKISSSSWMKSGTSKLWWSVFTVCILLFSCKQEDANRNAVMKGHFRQTITETGELEAVDARSFTMPRYGRYWYEMKIIGLLDHGTAVKAGDSLISFDPSEIKKFIIERETQLENERANFEKLVVSQNSSQSDLNSSLLTEEASFNLKKLEMESSKFESERIRKIKELEFKQAEINLEKVKKRIELNKIIADNDMKIQKIRVRQMEKEVRDAYAVLPTLTIRTPIPGIFQVANKRRSKELIRIGDEISFGNNLGNVPDLSWMKAVSTINETDIAKVKIGQKVKVRLDALPSVVFDGEISFISVLCHPYENSRRKVFDVEVKLLDSDERLKPGMTVSCEYIAGEYDDVLYVPNTCILNQDGRNYLFLKKGGSHERMEIGIVARNNNYTVVAGSVRKGQELIPVSEINQTQNQ